jgi:hypothetical protein
MEKTSRASIYHSDEDKMVQFPAFKYLYNSRNITVIRPDVDLPGSFVLWRPSMWGGFRAS